MAGKSGVCRTVGYVDPISGAEIIFERPRTNHFGKKRIAVANEMSARALKRILSAEWDELDDYLFPEMKEAISSLQFTVGGGVVIGSRRLV